MDSHDEDRGQIALLALVVVAALGLDLPRPLVVLAIAAVVIWIIQKAAQK